MRRILTLAVMAAALGALVVGTSAASSGTGGVMTVIAAAAKVPTVHVAGPQHWCGTNGVECSDPSVNWDEISGLDHAIKNGAPILPYIGHDEPCPSWRRSSRPARWPRWPLPDPGRRSTRATPS